MGDRKRKGHAIMISIPFQGHMSPFIDLALKLASKGLTITFVHLQFLHHKLSKAHHGNTNEVDFFSEARRSGLDIRYTTIDDGLPLEFDRDLNFDEYWGIMGRDFPSRVDEFVGKMIESDGDGVHFLVADTVYEWPAAIAEKHKLVNVSFWTQTALVFSLAYHWDLLERNGHFPCKDEIEEEINYIPGIESMSTKDLVHYMKESEVEKSVTKGTRLAFEGVKKADFILHNTVHELESQTLSALNEYQRNYAIGPISFSQTLPTSSVTRSLWSESDCTEWLEPKPPGSVLYVSFGSFVHTNKSIIEEIAYGLVLSGVHFIWVIRQGILSDGDANVLPAGFQDEVKDKGLIVPWCSQIRVLSDPAVGGFLTHSGWNSTVESIWCGVPMISYPVGFDQPTNRKLVVDDWKIGISLCDDGNAVDRNEVGEKIKRFMNGGIKERLGQRAIEMKGVLKSALEIDGSSHRNFDLFVSDLEDKIFAKTTK